MVSVSLPLAESWLIDGAAVMPVRLLVGKQQSVTDITKPSPLLQASTQMRFSFEVSWTFVPSRKLAEHRVSPAVTLSTSLPRLPESQKEDVVRL